MAENSPPTDATAPTKSLSEATIPVKILPRVPMRLTETARMSWYLKRIDGEVYGPVSLPTLQLWATNGRVAPNDKISTDQKQWMFAFDLAELSMDWKVELGDGLEYGPIHLLALRDLLREGSVTRRAKIKHKQSGEEQPVCEALLFELMKVESKAESTVSALTAQVDENERQNEKLQQALQNASEIESKLRDEIKELTEKQKQAQDLSEQVEKWKKLYEEELAEAATREAELKNQVRERKNDDPSHQTLVQEVEQWKSMHERAVAQIKQLKSQTVNPSGGSDMVPRAQLEDAMRKLSQIEHNYRQLLRTLNRSVGVRLSGRPVPQADNLQRRDIS